MPIQLYVIIGLLLSNMFTGGMWLYSKSTITTLTGQLVSAQAAKTEQDLTMDVTITENTLVEKTCDQQIEDLRNSYTRAAERNFAIENKLSYTKNTIDTYKKDINILTKKLNTPLVIVSAAMVKSKPPVNHIQSQPTPTYKELPADEKAIVSDYLSTHLPEYIEHSLYIRGVRESN